MRSNPILSRRQCVGVGCLSAFGLGLADGLRLRADAASDGATPAKSCILIWLEGGPSHLETFDPKPDAPAEVRGPFDSIATTIPGVRMSECLPRLAAMTDQLALVRSMTSPLGEHNFGTHYLMTGYRPTPALDYPSYGAVIARLRRSDGTLPPNMAVPSFPDNMAAEGFLDQQTRPFSIGGDPERSELKVKNLDLYPGVTPSRLQRRRQFVETMNRFHHQSDTGQFVGDAALQQAHDLVTSAEAKGAFDLQQETPSTRALYGRGGGNGIGQSCLLARRMVERGVPFVTVNSRGWDTHQKIYELNERYPGDQNAHLPSLDRAVSALISDLDQRGLLESTLVVVMGEFGRTPKINPAGGRDHWPNVFSVMLAGGGIRGGQVVGRSDALGELPVERPVTPANLAATIYRQLGISLSSELSTPDGRPVRIVPDGVRVIDELIA